jgi:hypothetical protein
MARATNGIFTIGIDRTERALKRVGLLLKSGYTCFESPYSPVAGQDFLDIGEAIKEAA